MRKRDALLFTSIGLGPAAWFLSMEANYAIAPLACPGQDKTALYVVSAAAALLALLAGAIAFTQFNLPEHNAVGVTNPARGRQRAMAIAGLGLSALSLLVIMAQAIPTLMLAGCE